MEIEPRWGSYQSLDTCNNHIKGITHNKKGTYRKEKTNKKQAFHQKSNSNIYALSITYLIPVAHKNSSKTFLSSYQKLHKDHNHIKSKRPIHMITKQRNQPKCIKLGGEKTRFLPYTLVLNSCSTAGIGTSARGATRWTPALLTSHRSGRTSPTHSP